MILSAACKFSVGKSAEKNGKVFPRGAVLSVGFILNDDASSKTAVSLSGVTALVIDLAIELDFGASGLSGSPTTNP